MDVLWGFLNEVRVERIIQRARLGLAGREMERWWGRNSLLSETTKRESANDILLMRG